MRRYIWPKLVLFVASSGYGCCVCGGRACDWLACVDVCIAGCDCCGIECWLAGVMEAPRSCCHNDVTMTMSTDDLRDDTDCWYYCGITALSDHHHTSSLLSTLSIDCMQRSIYSCLLARILASDCCWCCCLGWSSRDCRLWAWALLYCRFCCLCVFTATITDN